MEKGKFAVDYITTIKFNKDNLEVIFGGDNVTFRAIEGDEAPVRPRHIRLIANLQGVMQEYIRNN